MTKTINVEALVTVCGIVVGILGIGYAAGAHSKMNKVARKLDRTINDLADEVEIDIPERIINSALEVSVEKYTKKAVEKAANDVVDSIRKDIRNQVQNAIRDEASHVHKSVAAEIGKQAAGIDQRRLHDEIIKQARDEIVRKLDNKTDDIINDFNENLSNMRKIYQSIANTMTKDDDKKMTFSIG